VVAESFVLRIKFSGKNPAHRKSAKRYMQIARLQTRMTRPIMQKLTRIILTVITPLILGGLIYILFRATSLKMFSWFHAIGLDNIISYARHYTAKSTIFPTWVIFSLPDALWLFAFTNLMLIIWHDKFSMQSLFWLLVAPTVGILLEVGQALKIISGTFDFTDLILILISATIPFLFTNLNLKLNERF
jgi:hypothetical protein